MTFEEILNQAMALLQRQGRVSYRALKRQFDLDEAYVEDLKLELIEVHQVAVDQDNAMLVWIGGAAVQPPSAADAVLGRARAPDAAPLTYTPPHLTDKILAARPALEGERKQVTVLFADLKGSMELLADRDPEAARQLLDPALHTMMAAVHRYEGTVNQVLGDGIMALFGAPIAHEDHAVRACYAALAMQEAMRRYSAEVRRTHGVEVLMRVGLNSGEVVVRTIDTALHMDYSAVGQTTHLAARMEQLATPGSIRLTAATLRLVEGLVQVTALGPVPVKGLAGPVEVFELVGASTLRRRLQVAAARGLTRFVGRQAELAVLQQALEQAAAGHGQVVAAVGEAGVGKSRLVYECLHSHRTQGWLVLESASVSYGKATPYGPVLDLLKRYAHVEDHDDTRTIRAKVTGQVLTLDDALQETVPALLWLLDALPNDHAFLTLDPPQRRWRTLDALKRLLICESQVQPLLLVCEDLHWIDAETQALLDSLVESLPTARLLLLVNYRPEYQHGWGSKTYYTQLRLDPLPPTSAEEFLHALLGDNPSLAPLTPLLIARTSGNPFFLEESVRTLEETGVLVGERRAYRLAQPLASLQVPATVQAVLAARIDRLPPEHKRLLQTAAVIGTEVPWPLLQAIADVPEAALHQGLTRLQAAEFLYEARLFPELEYTFKHALTHEVAYGSLLHERRRTLHARIVEDIEGLYADRLTDQVERLANHAVRGELWDKARNYCQQAGARAASHSAYREAVGYFEQALAALAQLPDRSDIIEQAIDLRFDLRNALQPLDEHARILDHLRTAETLAERLDDPQRLGRIACYLCFSFSVMGEHDRAIAAGQRALALATTGGALDVQVVAQTFLGVAYYAVGDFRQGMDISQRVMALLTGELCYARFGLPILPAVLARGYLAWGLAELGNFTEVGSLGEDVVRLAETDAQPASIAIALWCVGLISRRQGNVHPVIPMLERSLTLCQNANIVLLIPVLGAILGATYVLAGHTAKALPLLDQVLERLASGSRMLYHALVLTEVSEALLLVGRLDEASALAGHLHELSRTHPGRGYQAHAYRLLGDVATRREPPDIAQAEAHYQQAQALAEELGMHPLQAHCHLGLGTLYAKMRQRQQAHAELSTAMALYRAMDMTFWLPQAEAALAQIDDDHDV
jgi:class 3 adenylate cyclase/tetratricopeptide (TPR) repeat protein